jgi:hypothetical protein
MVLCETHHESESPGAPRLAFALPGMGGDPLAAAAHGSHDNVWPLCLPKPPGREYSAHAWRMVSKLNISPFQAVSSPLDAPVISRRPSGVHCTSELGGGGWVRGVAIALVRQGWVLSSRS